MDRIKIIKKGVLKSNGRKYIVIKFSGKTRLTSIARRFGKDYYRGFGYGDKQEDGSYHQVLWKREKPLKTFTHQDVINWNLG